MPDMSGKVVAITGCTSGTGKILALTCAQKGAKVVLLNRKSERAEQALQDVAMRVEAAGGKAWAEGPGKPVFIPCDLMSFKSVQEAGEKVCKEFSEEGLDVLVNNAGIMAFKDVATEDGCDQQMQVNHLSHFLLTKLCMPALEVAAHKRGEARVVNHSSAARVMDGMDNLLNAKYLLKNGGNLGGDANTFFKGPQFQRYQQSKLANVVFTYALAAKLQTKQSKVKALCAHPGVSLATGLAAGTFTTGAVKPAPAPVMFAFKNFLSQSELDATVGILRSVCDPAAKCGEFFGPLGKGGGTGKHDSGEYKGKVGALKKEPFADQQAQDMLWEVSETVTGVKFDV